MSFNPFDIVIEAGETSGSHTLNLQVQDDDVDEGTEKIQLRGAVGSGDGSDGNAEALQVISTLVAISDEIDVRG